MSIPNNKNIRETDARKFKGLSKRFLISNVVYGISLSALQFNIDLIFTIIVSETSTSTKKQTFMCKKAYINSRKFYAKNRN